MPHRLVRQIYEDVTEGYGVSGLSYRIAKTAAEMRGAFNAGRMMRDATVGRPGFTMSTMLRASSSMGCLRYALPRDARRHGGVFKLNGMFAFCHA